MRLAAIRATRRFIPADLLPRRRRSRLEWAAIIALPVVFNAILAAYLFMQIDGGSLPIVGDAVPPPFAGSTEEVLPQSSRAEIVTSVESQTGSTYDCDGPWTISGGTSVWSCRIEDAVAVMYGRGPHGMFRLDVTWFGFDEAATELPAWAAAAIGPSPSADEAAAWVAQRVGLGGRTRVGGVSLEVGGAEGARSLVIEGD